MKHNTIILTLTVIAVMAGCQKNESEREKVDSRPSTALDVQYSFNGVETKSLSFTHEFSHQVVDVYVNSDGLRWDIESDRDWCKVIPEEHCGSGSFTLELEANENFDARESATLTFTAGTFRGFRLTVDQSASAFILSQPYYIAGQAGESFSIDVTTLDGVDWDVDSEEWIIVDRQAAKAPVDGHVTTTLNLTVNADEDESRLGLITLTAGAEKDLVYVWQFGSELEWKDGSIILPKEGSSSLSIVAPGAQIRKIDMPDFVTKTEEQIDKILEKISFSLGDNVSDCGSRDVDISLTLVNNTSTVVSFPPIKQDFIPAGGLMTAPGLLLFAQKVALGESTADWENEEGWVVMLQDIDMSGVVNWPGIGTPANPFSGKFDGNGKVITKLVNSSNGIFNYCEGESDYNPAIIKNLKLDKKCSFYWKNEDWIGDVCFGGIVSQASNAQISACSCAASIEFDGESGDDSPAWVGGVVGRCGDGVGLVNCSLDPGGKLTVSCTGEDAYIGGIAGSAVALTGCTMYGTLSVTGSISQLYLAGVTPVISSESVVASNAFGGTITLNGNIKKVYSGGLYAFAENESNLVFDFAEDRSSVSGTINVLKYRSDATSRVFVGGFLGYASPLSNISFKDYEVHTKIFIDQTLDMATAYFCAGGVLGGTSPDSKVSAVSFEHVVPQGAITFKFDKNNKPKSGILKGFYGGVAGFINGPAIFDRCVNMGPIGGVVTDSYIYAKAKNDVSANFTGGIAAYIEGGDSSFTACENSAVILNPFWCNQSASDKSEGNYLDHFHGVFCGGILGAFDMHRTVGSFKLSITDSKCTASVDALRGLVGGVVGYCQNATITSCDFIAGEYKDYTNQMGCHQGGIAGGINQGSISDCTVKANIHAGCPGSSDFSSPGGIVGRVFPGKPVSISGCRYFGTVKAVPSNGVVMYPGGIVGAGCADTAVYDCQYGGTMKKTDKNMKSETESEDINNNNLAQYVIGNEKGTATGTVLWDGN